MNLELLQECKKLNRYIEYTYNCMKMVTLGVRVDHIAAMAQIYKQSVLYHLHLNNYKDKVNMLDDELKQLKEEIESYKNICVLSEEDYFNEKVLNELLEFGKQNVPVKSIDTDDFKYYIYLLTKIANFSMNGYEVINFEESDPMNISEKCNEISLLVDEIIKKKHFEIASYEPFNEEAVASSFAKWIYVTNDFCNEIKPLIQYYITMLLELLESEGSE